MLLAKSHKFYIHNYNEGAAPKPMSVRVRKSVTSGQDERETTLDRACDEIDLPPTPVTPKLVSYLVINGSLLFNLITSRLLEINTLLRN